MTRAFPSWLPTLHMRRFWRTGKWESPGFSWEAEALAPLVSERGWSQANPHQGSIPLGKGTPRLSVDHLGNPWLRSSQEHRSTAHEPVGSTDQSHLQDEHPAKCLMHHSIHPNERAKELCLVGKSTFFTNQRPESEFSALYKTLNMANHVL